MISTWNNWNKSSILLNKTFIPSLYTDVISKIIISRLASNEKIVQIYMASKGWLLSILFKIYQWFQLDTFTSICRLPSGYCWSLLSTTSYPLLLLDHLSFWNHANSPLWHPLKRSGKWFAEFFEMFSVYQIHPFLILYLSIIVWFFVKLLALLTYSLHIILNILL